MQIDIFSTECAPVNSVAAELYIAIDDPVLLLRVLFVPWYDKRWELLVHKNNLIPGYIDASIAAMAGPIPLTRSDGFEPK